MKYKGYTGHILQVNLTQGTLETIPLSEKDVEDYIGGVGLAARITSEMISPGMDPLGEGNPLIFMILDKTSCQPEK